MPWVKGDPALSTHGRRDSITCVRISARCTSQVPFVGTLVFRLSMSEEAFDRIAELAPPREGHWRNPARREIPLCDRGQLV
jgi:hypothetical protein